MSLTHLIRRMNQTLAAELHQAECPLTDAQILVMNAVSRGDGLSQTDIVLATNIDRSTTADMVGRLVKAGLLKRARNPKDAREYIIRITGNGSRTLAASQATLRKVEKSLAAQYPILSQVAAE